jgi:hypothetical protein
MIMSAAQSSSPAERTMANEQDKKQNGAKNRSTAEAAARRKQWAKAGAAVGIGSAAIVAALLYANRGRKSDKG